MLIVTKDRKLWRFIIKFVCLDIYYLFDISGSFSLLTTISILLKNSSFCIPSANRIVHFCRSKYLLYMWRNCPAFPIKKEIKHRIVLSRSFSNFQTHFFNELIANRITFFHNRCTHDEWAVCRQHSHSRDKNDLEQKNRHLLPSVPRSMTEDKLLFTKQKI